ncbi:T9SS type A sorting domain-containing protein [Aquimarina aquimarini]|uniref:T9SS type A sorting domain-containing protein n=1 Tax=Aquimarina aquimarini TaxID=1191734 RepID=UPI000D5590AB|nr:T9SS type A sorting domain-containing protein [Aquimarina aquimarini]
MSKSFILGILCLVLLFVHQSYAQGITTFTCDQKAEELLKFKNDFKNYPPQLIDEMMEFIAPCAVNYKENLSAAYAKALLHFEKKDYGIIGGINYELSRYYLKQLADINYAPAMYTHSLNLVEGNYIQFPGRKLRHAEDYLKKLTNQSSYKKDVVNYLLGYIALKNQGLGEEIVSIYSLRRAKRLFEASKLPMAKHWLAVMHYFGYGTPQNKTKALQMLSENNILNSRILKQHLQSQNNDWIPISAEERFACIEGFPKPSSINTVIGNTKTILHGKFLEFNTSAIGVLRSVPITLEINVTQDYDSYKHIDCKVTINGVTTTAIGKIFNASYAGGTTMSFTLGTSLELPSVKRLLKDHPDHTKTTYKIGSMNLNEIMIDNKLALVAKVNSTSSKVVELDEVMRAPYRMILYPETPLSTTTTSITSLSNKTLKNAIPKVLDKNFATISPNPIGNEFNITYTLDQVAEVQVSVYDFFGQQQISLPSQKYTNEGTQTITVDSNKLPSGTYVIQMIVDGIPYSKTVVKL